MDSLLHAVVLSSGGRCHGEDPTGHSPPGFAARITEDADILEICLPLPPWEEGFTFGPTAMWTGSAATMHDMRRCDAGRVVIVHRHGLLHTTVWSNPVPRFLALARPPGGGPGRGAYGA